ncbi:hypothetical protein J7M22_03610 [Candidatus Poribacteria bacterium]|nr:hypothetical protein [Candidatus Poribacteria bacterium]
MWRRCHQPCYKMSVDGAEFDDFKMLGPTGVSPDAGAELIALAAEEAFRELYPLPGWRQTP